MNFLAVDSIGYSQSMDKNSEKISGGKSSPESFSSFLQGASVYKNSDESKDIPEAFKKLQVVMFQYFVKSLLPEETVKSLGGGFYGDFWKEILAENMSNMIVKQNKTAINLHSIEGFENTNFEKHDNKLKQ
ncbi:hypothetical protein [Candidatus Liberibacter sp.]|uniref:hypothetical protein n=1 Tax=Candidatus Liberibacter sp. TaxID=34022 RepID=UPI002174DDDE|nr:hypothetical protein [Candidatus Liberibacter sp.]